VLAAVLCSGGRRPCRRGAVLADVYERAPSPIALAVLGENGWAAGADSCGQLVEGRGGGPDPYLAQGGREDLPYLPSWAAGLAAGHPPQNGLGLRSPLAA